MAIIQSNIEDKNHDDGDKGHYVCDNYERIIMMTISIIENEAKSGRSLTGRPTAFR